MKNKISIKSILQWMFVLFCFTAVLAYGFTLGSILTLICGVVAMPIKPIRDLWNKFLPEKRRWIKRAGIIVLFFVAMSAMPTSETEPIDNSEIEQTAKDEDDTEKEIDSEEKEESEEKSDSKEETSSESTRKPSNLPQSKLDLSTVVVYSGSPYFELNGNVPTFAEVSTESFEEYSDLDGFGRCGVAYACIGKDIMPTEERGTIGQVKPTGWHTVKYNIVDGNYLYNRCHLIGYQLAGENANTKNLITGTRYLNVEGMLPFENMVADYVKETGNHVMYRVTPFFNGSNLLASGVQMEAYSVEDNGDGICFNVYVYNVQPGITIDYATGESKLTETSSNNVSSENSNTANGITSSSSESSSGSGETTSSGSNSTSNGSESNGSSTNSSSSSSSSSSNSSSENSSSSGSTATGGMVWKSATGSKYHSINDCGNMNPDKAVQITVEEAKNQGMEACSKCY